jgi:hypothetical protein
MKLSSIKSISMKLSSIKSISMKLSSIKSSSMKSISMKLSSIHMKSSSMFFCRRYFVNRHLNESRSHGFDEPMNWFTFRPNCVQRGHQRSQPRKQCREAERLWNQCCKWWDNLATNSNFLLDCGRSAKGHWLLTRKSLMYIHACIHTYIHTYIHTQAAIRRVCILSLAMSNY